MEVRTHRDLGECFASDQMECLETKEVLVMPISARGVVIMS